MSIQYVPEVFYEKEDSPVPEVLLHEYSLDKEYARSRVHLSRNVFSMLLEGQKELHLQNESVQMDSNKIILIANGNCLMKERVAPKHGYKSLLFFFSNDDVEEFLVKFSLNYKADDILLNFPNRGFFVIEKDAFINNYISSVQLLLKVNSHSQVAMLKVKLFELFYYLFEKEGEHFAYFLRGILGSRHDTTFKKIIEGNVYSNLSIEEVAFLCNMSLSSFKRHFILKYGMSPGKWFQIQRLTRAKELLEKGNVKASEIYTDFGYENLSNFSAAFKSIFGVSPRKVISN